MNAIRRFTTCVLLLGFLTTAGHAQPLSFDDYVINQDLGIDDSLTVSDQPTESVDPFTGHVSIVHRDLVLPGKAGLDLVVTRTYRGWNVNPPQDLKPPYITAFGRYGWNLHMGFLLHVRDPYDAGVCTHSRYIAPDGSSKTFIPPAEPNCWDAEACFGPQISDKNISRDYDQLEVCNTVDFCLHTADGLRYEFDRDKRSFFPQLDDSVWPVTRILDPHGNSITMHYQPGSLRLTQITDSYGRQVTFDYQNDLVRHMYVDGHLYKTYQYEVDASNRSRLPQVYGDTKRQRCWVHKTENVLDKLPEDMRGQAKQRLQQIWMAPDRAPGEAGL